MEVAAIQIDDATWRLIQNALAVAPGRAATACKYALNRTVRSVRAQAAKQISEELGLKAGALTRPHRFGSVSKGGKGKALDIKEATETDLTARLLVRGNRIPVVFFRYESTPLSPHPPRTVFHKDKGFFTVAHTRTGVRWMVGTRSTFGANTFVATMQSGHTGIWTRRPNSRKLWEVSTISIPVLAARNTVVRQAIMNAGREMLRKRAQYEIMAMLRKLERDTGTAPKRATRYRLITGGLGQ